VSDGMLPNLALEDQARRRAARGVRELVHSPAADSEGRATGPPASPTPRDPSDQRRGARVRRAAARTFSIGRSARP
jgi:hypothetical protein